jgi:diguanylate cyclase (GGDEF)-like protein
MNTARPVTIVCVDDDALVLGALREQLRRGLEGPVDIETAGSGEEGLALLAELMAEGASVPLLISDQSMPGLSGADFLARAHERYPGVLKVMLSGAADAKAVGDAVNRASLYRILHKPWHHDDLLLTAREALRSAAQQEALARTHRELEHSMHALRHQALHDSLTGLPNRAQFDAALSVALGSAAGRGQHVGVLFLDLDRFKRINDTLGHAVGDELLRAVVQRLRTSVREGDLIARWGGDEFTVLLPALHSRSEADAVAQRVVGSMSAPVRLAGEAMQISASVGLAVYPDDGRDAETLLRNADTALYRVKADGRNGWRAYDPTWHREGDRTLALESALHGALGRGEISLHYQPQRRCRDGRLSHVEALMRWQHPVHGWVPPQTFIPLAEESGAIVELGAWALHEACGQLRHWREQGVAGLVTSVNVSAVQFARSDLPKVVREALRSARLPANTLELEITEATAVRDLVTTAEVLHALAGEGVCIALDDFGTGYAPLSHVKDLPCHVLKVDRSFARQLAPGGKDAAIVAAVVALGHGLGMEVVAEGVESEIAAAQLRRLGCDRLQGYWIGRPVAAAELDLAGLGDGRGDYTREQGLIASVAG